MVSAKKRIWGWYFFDWASQPYNTLVLTFIFGPYFAEVARAHFAAQGMEAAAAGAAAQSAWGWGLTASGIIIAILAPLLGAVADQSGRRMVWIWIFSVFYVVGSLGLWWLVPVQPPLMSVVILFGIGLIGMEFTTIFTNALLPDLAEDEQLGGISGSGFAFGYAGGVVSLAIMLALFAESGVTGKTLIGLDPILGLDATAREGTRFVGPFSAIWYVVFMIPFFLWVREPRSTRAPVDLGRAWRDLMALLRSLPGRRSLSAYLGSSMLFRDALNGLYAFGGVYASGVLGWSVIQIGIFGVISAVAAAIVSWIGGRADRRYGPKPVLIATVLALIAVCTVIVGMTPASVWGVPISPATANAIFYACGVVIGGAGGSLQSASRTMMVRHTTPDRATEAFGLYALSGKATAFLAPALIAGVTAITSSQRLGISPLIGLFILSLVLLIWVKPQGDRA
ncbi:MFS transporter [Paracoccus sp. p3-h83]|uniref:MFS transporter n=1 Tax=Paracoccus sp. p3-h83 TaxID=3342805 RepID=UPI0035B91E66